MIEVFVEYSGQNGQRTMIPDGPFTNKQDAYAALIDFANLHHGNFKALVQAIDAYGFIVNGSGTVRSSTKP